MADIVSGTFIASGESDDYPLPRDAFCCIEDIGNNVVDLEITLDDGATWNLVERFTDNQVGNILWPHERIASVRLNCSTHNGGTVRYMIG